MFVYVNGDMVPKDEATVSTFDHGLVTGDGIFETISVYGGQVFALRRHLERLERSAVGLLMEKPNLPQIRAAIESTVKRNELSEGKIRVTYTSGISGLGSDRPSQEVPNLVVAVDKCEFGNGTSTKVAVSPWPRNERGALAGLKTTSYGENVLALAYAKSKGATEALFPNLVGNVCEGTGSNIFMVIDGKLVTPPLASGPLAGITRALVMELAVCEEMDVPMESLFDGTVSEAFLTSTIREVQAVVQIDDFVMGDGKIGPVTQEIVRAFSKLKENVDPDA